MKKEVECDACDRTPFILTAVILARKDATIYLCQDCMIHLVIDEMEAITREWMTE